MHKDCTIFQTSDFIGKKWTLLILFELYKGNEIKRHSDIKKALPKITPKILSTRLKELENQGLIKKRIDTTKFPIKTFYSLTPSGKDFFKVIHEIKNWSLKWKVKNQVCQSTDCQGCTL
jgi:DNA-binding HxlR family transcriptional regulator